MTAASKLRQQAATAAKASRREALDASVNQHRTSPLTAAHVQRPVSTHRQQHSPPRDHVWRTKAAPEDETPSYLTRLKAFLPFKGFNIPGVRSANVLPLEARSRRAVAYRVQAPRLKTVPTARDVVDNHPLPTAQTRSAANPDLASETPQAPNLETVHPPENSTEKMSLQEFRGIFMSSAVNSARRLKGVVDTTRTLVPRNPLTPPMPKRVNALQQILGLLNVGSTPQDAIFVAIDTETADQGVREIGVSTFDTRDIANIRPDCLATNWIPKVKHWHYDITDGDPLHTGSVAPIFCRTEVRSPGDVRTLILALLHMARQPSPEQPARPVYLVGQSVSADVKRLRSSQTLNLNFAQTPDADFAFDGVFDTLSLATQARDRGAYLPRMALGPLARSLGVPSEYHSPLAGELLGTHNASNDAAYSMMAMLLLAVRWNNLPSAYDAYWKLQAAYALRESSHRRHRQRLLDIRAYARERQQICQRLGVLEAAYVMIAELLWGTRKHG